MIVEVAWPEGLAEAPGLLARSLELAAFLVFATASVALAVIDLVTHRLPRTVVLVSAVLVALLLTGSAASSGQWSRVAQALLGAAVLFLGYLALAMIAPTAVGGGDVRLAALIGLALGWVGWGALVVGALAGFVLGGLWAIGLLAQRGARLEYSGAVRPVYARRSLARNLLRGNHRAVGPGRGGLSAPRGRDSAPRAGRAPRPFAVDWGLLESKVGEPA